MIQNTRTTNLAVKFCILIAASKYLQSQADRLPLWVAKITSNSPSSCTVTSTAAMEGSNMVGNQEQCVSNMVCASMSLISEALSKISL